MEINKVRWNSSSKTNKFILSDKKNAVIAFPGFEFMQMAQKQEFPEYTFDINRNQYQYMPKTSIPDPYTDSNYGYSGADSYLTKTA